MKFLYCWRCKADMPMLEEEEFRSLLVLYNQARSRLTASDKDFTNLYADNTDVREKFRHVREAYKRLTGIECHENAIAHHRVSLYGPPCSSCGKPLRTPLAAYCAFCGRAYR